MVKNNLCANAGAKGHSERIKCNDKNMQTKVSMVVACYNKSEYIDEMLQSVHEQEYDNIELILVNDGSTDGTRERIAEWEPKLQLRGFDVIIIDQENQGVGAAVRRGLSQISGDYVCSPDCDDHLKSNYVSRMASVLEADQTVDWVQCNMPLSITNNNVKRENYLLLLLESGIWSIWRKLIRSSYLNQCRVVENFVTDRLSQEMAINIPLTLGGSFPFFINENLYHYQTRKNSIMEAARSSNIMDFFVNYKNLTIKILKSFNALDERTELMTQIGIEKIITSETGKTDGELRSLMLLYLEKYTNIQVSSLNGLNTSVLQFAFETLLFSNKANEPESLTGSLKNAERIIACACLGSSGMKMLPVFQFLGLEQIICWDENGGNDVYACGYGISRPRYHELTDKDLVLILSTRPDVILDISEKVNEASVFTVDAMKQYLRWKISNIGELV